MKWIILMMAPLGAISCSNWILVWAFLELSSFSFVILSKSSSSSESMLKYFLVQTISSIFILSSISMKMSSSTVKSSVWMIDPTILIIMSLLVKSGLAPLHFWMPSVSKGLSWNSLTLFLTIQKVGPMTLILSIINTTSMVMVILLCSLIGTLSQMSTISLKILMTYSSVSHSGWMLLGSISKMEIYYLYMMVYSLIITQIALYLSNQKITSIVSMKKSKPLLIMLMSLGGLPPLLGFFPKWMSILTIIYEDLFKMVCIFLMIMACMNVYIYTRISSSSLLKTPMKLMLKTNSKDKMFHVVMLNLMTLPLMFMLSL